MEDKPPPARCELGNLKEKILVQREVHSSEFWTLLQHDEVVATSQVRLDNGKNSHPPIIGEEVQEPPSLATRNEEIQIH